MKTEAIAICILSALFAFVPSLGNYAKEWVGGVEAVQDLYEYILLFSERLEPWIPNSSSERADVAGGEEGISATKQTSFEGKFSPRKLAHDDYTIGWVSALPKELTAAMA